MTSLVRLDVSNNKLATFPRSCWKLNRLRRLILSSNCFAAFPFIGSKEAPPGLIELRLDRNVIDALPDDDLRWVSTLQTLDLAGNKLSSLPDHLSMYLHDLAYLNVCQNHLDQLPVNIGWLLLKDPPMTLLASHNPLKALFDEGFRSIPVEDFTSETTESVVTMDAAQVAESVDKQVLCVLVGHFVVYFSEYRRDWQAQVDEFMQLNSQK